MSAAGAGQGVSAVASGLPTSALLERVRRGVIGEGELMDGPFGPRRVTYADYTASGRQIQGSSVPRNPGPEDHHTRHDLPPAGSPQARRRTCYSAYPMGYHREIF